MADMETGNEAGQESASTTERIPSETATAQAAGNEQSSNSQTQAAATTTSTNNNQQTQADKDKSAKTAADNDADKRIKDANREAANYRTQLREIEAKHKEASDTLSTVTAERDTLRNEIRELRVTREVETVVNAAQPHKVADVMRLIDLNSIKIDGRTGQIDRDAILAQVEELRKDSGYLFKGAGGQLGADAGAGGSMQASVGMNDLIRRTMQGA